MRNSYLRPLNFNYVDTYEKKYQTEEIPLKFMKEPDDYQKRVRDRSEEGHYNSEGIEEIISAFAFQEYKEEPQIIPDVKLQKPQSVKFQLPSPAPLPQQSIKKVQSAVEIAPSVKEKKQSPKPFFFCCQQLPEDKELCGRCAHLICRDCTFYPQRLQKCTRCLQRLCRDCKTRFNITFPDYKIRNYPIQLKIIDDLHFQYCQCKNCQQKN